MHKKGKTVSFADPPVITGHAGVAGKKEGEGPLGGDFDAVFADTTMGQQSFELAESAMLRDAILRALSAAGKSPSDVDFILSGDLLDQCMGSAFAIKDMDIPAIGLYGACSTMALSLGVGAMLIDAGAKCCVAGTSRSASAQCPVDGDRRRQCSAGKQGRWRAYTGGAYWHHYRLWHYGCRQYGRSYGAGGCPHHS